MGTTIKKYIFRSNPYPPNTFVGGSGTVYTTEALFVTAIKTVTAPNIENYVIDGSNNIEMHIQTNHELVTQQFVSVTSMTYYLDIRGKVGRVGHGSFANCSNLKRIWFPKATVLYGPSGYYGFQSCNLTGKLDFPLVTHTGNAIFNYNPNITSLYYPSLEYFNLQNSGRDSHRNLTGLKRLYCPSFLDYNVAPSVYPATAEFYYRYFLGVASGVKFYVPSALATSNGGARDVVVAYFEDNRAMVPVYITNSTAPNAVSNLSASSITATTVNLNFTAPTVVTNANDFYEVWIDDGVTKWHQYCTYQEIAGTGGTVTGLVTGTTYDIKIKTADIFYNLSGFSNTIQITTL